MHLLRSYHCLAKILQLVQHSINCSATLLEFGSDVNARNNVSVPLRSCTRQLAQIVVHFHALVFKCSSDKNNEIFERVGFVFCDDVIHGLRGLWVSICKIFVKT